MRFKKRMESEVDQFEFRQVGTLNCLETAEYRLHEILSFPNTRQPFLVSS